MAWLRLLLGPSQTRGWQLLFSRAFGIRVSPSASWFDPVLTSDTPLFVDPFLIEYCKEPELHGAFQEVFEHFRELFVQLAADRTAPIVDQLYFPEVPETALGYTGEGIEGAGSARGYAAKIRRAMEQAIAAGVKAPRHFEEIGLLSEGIGADRISDITTRLLIPRLGAYTARVCRQLRVPVEPYRLWTYQREKGRIRKTPVHLQLPRNPRSPKGRAVLLVPESVLRQLPTINRNAFEDFLWDAHNEELRKQFDVEVKEDLRPKLTRIANRNVQWLRDYVTTEETRGPRPYEFERDPAGLVWTYQAGYEWGYTGAPKPLSKPTTAVAVFEFVQFLAGHFKSHVESQSGWELLWDTDRRRHKSERAAQRLFQGMASGACDLLDVKMSPESNAGTGPVDFLFTTGYKATVLLELKHITNSGYWDGPAAQLPAYLRAQQAKNAMFMAIAYRDKEVASRRFTELAKAVREAARQTGFRLTSETVDARVQRLPASRRRRSNA